MITNLLRHHVFTPQLSRKAVNSPRAQAQQQGFTLIECLVAIVMVALVSSAIAPALVISVATRVHSQRAEQALALAQSEIENTRVVVERGGYAAAALPPLAAGTADADITTAPAPTALGAGAASAIRAEPIDLNGDGETDFFVQRYRAEGQANANGIPIAFAMGVRVYDRSATGTLSTDPASLVMTASDRGRSTRPMVSLYTTIAASDEGDSMCNLITYFNSTTTGPDKALPTLCEAIP
ncbi:prepilin-type N-terminal cleavage/methylation domain-containing protein [Leptolyngbya sp. CCNP1308]|uniref:prepilin-type N-terminal cleavage/methylation domain-containing protein n=1 Tax=Leptolyngbya sp. CCNP1308 TaxID=3110255 RepID=UPI002B207631|nr:prepilin-type N-terminal cleavage/methylation domain-containing protein [Leptolyngbya sp. CCNP1308]MEA5451358.1 prepilin-type N-terminal cleavage/methylation domain-containing protein [Leptolyngbya sp. CCNP1308]